MKRTKSESERENASPSTRSKGNQRETLSSNRRDDPVASLQRAVGNQAVQSYVRNGQGDRSTGDPDYDGQSRPTERSTLGSKSRRRRLVADAVIRPKLSVNEPGDKYEREADRVAERVMRLPEPETAVEAREEEVTERIQRMCPRCRRRFRDGKSMHCEECEAELQRSTNAGTSPMEVNTGRQPRGLLQRQVDLGDMRTPVEEEEEDEEVVTGVEPTPVRIRELEESNVAPKREAGTHEPENGASAHEPGAGTSGLLDTLDRSGPGQPLDRGARKFMERRFGHDFSEVRIHTGDWAHRAAQSIRAKAFTIGQNIWFSRGEYAPNSERGRRLLAHELTHTLQQRGGTAPMDSIQRSICPQSCVEPVSNGRLCKSDTVNRDNCGERGASSESDKISHIHVILDTQTVHLFWNGTPRTDQGRKESVECTPNASETPKGWDEVGVKCGRDHTSWKGYNMAWFTAFKSHGYRYGFHNSQPVGAGHQSAGCVRVSCDVAKRINQNTESNWTSIIVRNSAPGD